MWQKVMEIKKKVDIKRDGIIVVLGGAIIICLWVYAYINWKKFADSCDTDMYADVLLAKKMWEQKTLFPDGWVFGNQYYVVATPVVAAIFYGLLGNTNRAMRCATECMTILILASFLWMLFGMDSLKERAREKWKYGLLCCLLLLVLPIESGYHYGGGDFFYFQCSYYACYIISAFVIFGDYIRSFSTEKPRWLTWTAALLLCFATGMQSIRETAVAILPIAAYEVLLLLAYLKDRHKDETRKSRMHLIRAISYFIANIVGIIVIKVMDIPHVSIVGDYHLTKPQDLLSSFQQAWNVFCMYIRIPGIFSAETHWFYKIFWTFVIAVVILAAICLLKDAHKKEKDELRIFLLCLFGVVGTIASGTFLNISLHTNYMFMWCPLVAVSAGILLRRLLPQLRIVFISGVCILCMANLYFSTGMAGILYKFTDEPIAQRDMAVWAMNEGYEYVYGDLFTAPRVAIYSGGSLEAGYWMATGTIYEPLDYLNLQNIYGQEENEKAIYVFTNADEEQGLDIAKERGVQMTKVADFGVYRAYTASEPLMDRSE